jgi:quercetin dioxygenase-like cupin family protein
VASSTQTIFGRNETNDAIRTRCLVRSAVLAGVLSLAAVSPVLAGECPAGEVGVNPLPGAANAPVGVTEMELISIDLSKEKVNLPERRLRFRHMEIAPGGVVPLHTHADRPALIMVNHDEVYEYSSQCTVPLLHKAGEIAKESNGLMHWWRNERNVTVVLTIADIVNDKKPDTMMPKM